MHKKVTFFLILIFALNTCFSGVAFDSSAAASKKINAETPKEQEESYFAKAFKQAVLLVGFVFQKLIFSFLGKPEIIADYQLTAEIALLPQNKKLREIYLKEEDPSKRFKMTQEERKLYMVYIHSEEHRKQTDRPFAIYLPILLYKEKKINFDTNEFVFKNTYGKPINTAQIVKTKYGEMIKISYEHGYLDLIDAVVFKQKTNHLFPYRLSEEFSIAPKTILDAWKYENEKGISSGTRHVETWIYVKWEGKGHMEIQFQIDVGVGFGYAGSIDFGYGISSKQTNKNLEIKDIPDMLIKGATIRKLLVKKPGWYKIHLNEVESLSAL